MKRGEKETAVDEETTTVTKNDEIHLNAHPDSIRKMYMLYLVVDFAFCMICAEIKRENRQRQND